MFLYNFYNNWTEPLHQQTTDIQAAGWKLDECFIKPNYVDQYKRAHHITICQDLRPQSDCQCKFKYF